jgi:formylglycine-generating enzyme
MQHRTTALYLIIAGLAVACNGSSGGSSGTGGKPGTGGTVTGGSIGTGGSGSGGTSSSGGTTGTGGASTGGSATGGSAGAGGAGGATTAAAPSCQEPGAGRSDCGAGHESCCTSTKVPGGTFYRTYANDGSGAKDTSDPATISDFRLDKYLVTVGRYRKFVAVWDGGSGYAPPVGTGKHAHLNGGKGLADSGTAGAYETGWTDSDGDNLAPNNDNLDCQSGASTWTSDPGDHENLPMNCVNWWEAYAFCIWDGGFLPSEAEYVYAAAGGSEQREYPWGTDDPAADGLHAIYSCNFPQGSPVTPCEKTVEHIAPVGTASKGAGRWGQLDLVGNLQEWYLDWFAPAYGNPCTDCADLTKASGRAPRDGYFASTDKTLLLAAYRNNGFYPTNRFYSFGFRCARAP